MKVRSFETLYASTGRLCARLLFAGLLLWCSRGWAAETNLYTLADCIRIGLSRSAAARNAQRDRLISETLVTQARSEALPNVSASGNYTRLDEVEDVSVGDDSYQAGSLDNYSAALEVQQLLYSGGRVSAALRAARLARVHADLALQEVEGGLVRDIRAGFYGILLLRESVEVLKASVAQTGALLEQTRQKRERGTASEFDLLAAQVRLLNEEPELVRARNAYALALADFKRLVNLDAEAVELEGSLDLAAAGAPLDELQALAAESRPALARMKTEVLLMEQDVAATRAGLLPSLSASFSYNGANSYGFVSFQDQWQWHWNAGLTLSWDIWDGGLTRGAVREKQLEAEKMRTLVDDFADQVSLEVTRAFLDLQHAREAAAAGKGNVELAERALAIARTRYESGLGTYLEFTDANVALSRARLSYLQALHDSMAARAQLDYASGRR